MKMMISGNITQIKVDGQENVLIISIIFIQKVQILFNYQLHIL